MGTPRSRWSRVVIKVVKSELDISLFRTVDDSGYNPFTDVIRYGDYKTNKWFIDNILTNINYIEDAFVNCFVNNTGMMYLLENSDLFNG